MGILGGLGGPLCGGPTSDPDLDRGGEGAGAGSLGLPAGRLPEFLPALEI